jgi:hypothetical protein
MGEIVNYMQLDTARLEHVVHSIHTVWDGALQVSALLCGVRVLCVMTYLLHAIDSEGTLRFTPCLQPG